MGRLQYESGNMQVSSLIFSLFVRQSDLIGENANMFSSKGLTNNRN